MERGVRGRAWMQAMLLGVALALAAPAHADELDRSVELATAGLKLYNRGAYAEAYDKFYLAEQLAHSPVFSLYLARAKAGLGEFLAARELYQAVVNEALPDAPPATWTQAQADAATELAALNAKIPKLHIETTPPNAAVMLDGKPITQRVIDVDPGEHRVEAIFANRRVHQVVVVAEGAGTKRMRLVVAAAQPVPAPMPGGSDAMAGEARPGPLWPGIVTTSVGAAGVATGIVLGSLALSLDSDLSTQCDDAGVCPPALGPDLDRLSAYEIGSTVGFIAGGVLSALGVTLLIVRPGGQSALRLNGNGLTFEAHF